MTRAGVAHCSCNDSSVTNTRDDDPSTQPLEDSALKEPTAASPEPEFHDVEPEDEDEVVVVYVRRPYWWWWVASVAAVVLTFVVARAIPPWHPIGTWWGTFFTSAGFGGSLAVVGAGTAAVIALHNSRKDREQKQTADEMARWWDRFAWACEQAISKEKGESEMGVGVLRNLIKSPLTRNADLEMVVDILNVVDVDRPLVGVSDDNADAATNDAPATS